MKKWHIVLLFLLAQILFALVLWRIAYSGNAFSNNYYNLELLFLFFIVVPCIMIPCALIVAIIVEFTGSVFYKNAIWISFLFTIFFWFVTPVLYFTSNYFLKEWENKRKDEAWEIEQIKNKRRGSTIFLAEQIAWLWISEIDRYKWKEATANCEVVLKNGDRFSFYTRARHDTVNIRYKLSNLAHLRDTVFWVNKTYNISKFFLSEEAISKAETFIENKEYNYMNTESSFGITLPDKDKIFYSIAEKQNYPEYRIKVMPRHLRIFQKDLTY